MARFCLPGCMAAGGGRPYFPQPPCHDRGQRHPGRPPCGPARLAPAVIEPKGEKLQPMLDEAAETGLFDMDVVNTMFRLVIWLMGLQRGVALAWEGVEGKAGRS